MPIDAKCETPLNVCFDPPTNVEPSGAAKTGYGAFATLGACMLPGICCSEAQIPGPTSTRTIRYSCTARTLIVGIPALHIVCGAAWPVRAEAKILAIGEKAGRQPALMSFCPYAYAGADGADPGI